MDRSASLVRESSVVWTQGDGSFSDVEKTSESPDVSGWNFTEVEAGGCKLVPSIAKGGANGFRSFLDGTDGNR